MLILQTPSKKIPKVVVDLFKDDLGPQVNLKLNDNSTPKYLLRFSFRSERLKIMQLRLPVAEARKVYRPDISYPYPLVTKNDLPTYI